MSTDTVKTDTAMKAIYVVSSYTVAGENEIGSGGFWWLPEGTTFESAMASYYSEVEAWKKSDAVVRLVRLTDIPAHLDGDALTEYIDEERTDEVEFTLVPLATIRLSTATEGNVF